MGNWFKTTLLLGAMTALMIFLGNMFGGRSGMIFAFILAMGMNFFSYWFSDKIVLSMYRAQEIGPSDHPILYDIVQELAHNAGLPMPKVFIIPEASPNAFATGRNPEHAAVAVTEGLLKTMDREELKGVLAHEMAHVKNRDILIGSIAATMAGAIMILANMAKWSLFFGGMRDDEDEGGLGIIGVILMAVIAPIAAMLIQMAISRSREYHADETGARIAGSPFGLASALEKLAEYSRSVPLQANPATAHMFIVNPLSGSSIAHLFSTHPPIEERIARLRGMKTKSNTTGNMGGEDAEGFWRSLE